MCSLRAWGNTVVTVSPKSAFVKRRIEIVKENVPVWQLANDLLAERGENPLRRAGEHYRGVCPLCGNGAHSQAFSALPNVFFCFACHEGGDVVTLAQKAGNFAGPGMAASWLASRYGIELPSRPDSWYRKVDRQGRLREQIREKRRNVLRRRLFSTFIEPMLEEIEDPEGRAKQTRLAWEDFKDMPVMLRD